MKDNYKWNYNIKIKTKEGTYEYEQPLDKLEELLQKHKGYEEVVAKQNKGKVKKIGTMDKKSR